MDALAALTTRVSPAALDTPGPSAAALETILQAAVAAPDHGRMKPWRFILIEGTAREKFGALLAQSLQRREPAAPAGKLEAERKKALRAPLIIVVAAAVQPNQKVPEIEQVVAVGAAAQNILVAAHALGFGGFWRTGANAYDVAMKRALGLAETDAIVGFLYLGTTKTPGPMRQGDTTSVTRRWAG
ncbi:MAG: nitroreductase [Alphaproteobacteria bacterium]|nr:nitroreductase [Alphaproteobacteria bacterium]